MSRDEILRYFANKYIWWKLPYDVMETPERIVAQAMRYANSDELSLLWKIKRICCAPLIMRSAAGLTSFWSLVLDFSQKIYPGEDYGVIKLDKNISNE